MNIEGLSIDELIKLSKEIDLRIRTLKREKKVSKFLKKHQIEIPDWLNVVGVCDLKYNIEQYCDFKTEECLCLVYEDVDIYLITDQSDRIRDIVFETTNNIFDDKYDYHVFVYYMSNGTPGFCDTSHGNYYQIWPQPKNYKFKAKYQEMISRLSEWFKQLKIF